MQECLGLFLVSHAPLPPYTVWSGHCVPILLFPALTSNPGQFLPGTWTLMPPSPPQLGFLERERALSIVP